MSKLEKMQEWLEYLEKNYEDGIESAFSMADNDEFESICMEDFDGRIPIEMVATTTDSEALAKEYGPSFFPEKIVTNGQLRDKIAEARSNIKYYLSF